MAYTRTLAELEADVRYRADIPASGATARHPSTAVQRLLVESLQTLRALLTDAGSHRFLAPVAIDTFYAREGIHGAVGLQTAISPSSFPVEIESIRALRVKWGGQWRELRRVGLEELADVGGRAEPTGPVVWADGGMEITAAGSGSTDVARRTIWIAPWLDTSVIGTSPLFGSGEILCLGIPGLGELTSASVVQLEQYGYEWVIADVVGKIAVRDNDAKERAALAVAAKQEAEARMLATIRRERGPAAVRREVVV